MIHLLRMDQNTTENSVRLGQVLRNGLAGHEFKRIRNITEFLMLAKTGGIKKVLFAVKLPENGYAPEWFDLISALMDYPDVMEGIEGAVIVDGAGPLFTKDMARRLIFAANHAGCSFMGKPLVEATGDLYNFKRTAEIKSIERETAYQEAVTDLINRLDNSDFAVPDRQKILAIHASDRTTSNSLVLLDKVVSQLGDKIEYKEISIRNGELIDCRGCSFEECKHFGESGECFYGGPMVEQVYPAILESDSLILVCPNYNDSVGANISAMFNRLTALFYNNSFEKKNIYSIIVSGYSGGDILAQQIIGTMNCNKGFRLPGHFALMATANDPGSVLEVAGIEDRISDFANNMHKIRDREVCGGITYEDFVSRRRA